MTDSDIISHFISSKGKIISILTKDDYLDKHIEYKTYLNNRYDDSESISETIYRIYHQIENRPTCIKCGSKVKYIGGKKGFKDFCSVSCSRKYIRQNTNNININDDIVKQDFLLQDGQLNLNKIKEKYIIEHGYKEYLENRYQGVSQWSEIIYLIVNGYNEPPKCEICGNKAFFDGTKKGYWKTCYNGKCVSKLKYKNIEVNDENIIKYLILNNQVKDVNKDFLKTIGFYDYMYNRFEDIDENTSISEIVYRIKNNIEEIPDCPVCHKHLNFTDFKNGYGKYHAGCVNKAKSIEIFKKRGLESYYNEKGNLVIKNMCSKHGDIEITDVLLFMKNRLMITRFDYNKNNLDDICPYCHPMRDPQTYIESIIKRILDNLDIEYVQHYKELYRYESSNRKGEVDFWIPDYNIAIECNGMYWHAGIDSYKKSLERYKKLHKQGIRLITFWEYDIKEKSDIIESYLKTVFNKNNNKVYARKCIVKEVSNNDMKEFLLMNHLQGPINASIKLGLYYDNDLIEIMTFGSYRKSLGSKKEEGKYELYRLATKDDYVVIGGASKLLNHFIKNYEWKEIVSYCDKEISEGNVYRKLGFNQESDIDKGYFYIDTHNNMRKINRFSLRKDIIDDNSNRSEEEIANELGYLRCYTLGNYKFIMKK